MQSVQPLFICIPSLIALYIRLSNSQRLFYLQVLRPYYYLIITYMLPKYKAFFCSGTFIRFCRRYTCA